MKYLLDTNSLNLQTLQHGPKRKDICTIQDVVDEHTSYGSKTSRVESAGIDVIQIRTKHLLRLSELLAIEGSNTSLIRLYTSEGTADVMLIAFVLSEREIKDTLFDEEYTIVTNDEALIAVALKNRINCVFRLPNIT
jgi:hypothetical protein